MKRRVRYCLSLWANATGNRIANRVWLDPVVVMLDVSVGGLAAAGSLL